MAPTVRIHVITYRRPVLLRRCLKSLLAQTFPGWTAEVLNDDPSDGSVAALVAELGDPRIRLSDPCIHRGATGNFNHAFRDCAEPFASLLEDDNWWAPRFLDTMLHALEEHPEAELACGNERIWREGPDRAWTDTGSTVWPLLEGTSLFSPSLADLCGSAKLCNSSLLYRTRRAGDWRTPGTIPVDVTEHFRERVIPAPFLLVHEPLTNYAVTLGTARSNRREIWGGYQLLLIGSVFRLLPPPAQRTLAAALYASTRKPGCLGGANLVGAGFLFPEARALWTLASPHEKARFLASSLRHPVVFLRLRRFRRTHRADWDFLVSSPAADAVHRAAGRA